MKGYLCLVVETPEIFIVTRIVIAIKQETDILRSTTAVQQLLNAISANIFQFSSSASVSNNIVVPKSANVIVSVYYFTQIKSLPNI